MIRMPGATINRNFITQVNADSGSLTSATKVVHRFSEKGEHKGVLFSARGVAAGEFSIMVGAEEGSQDKEADLPKSVQVDLTTLLPLVAGGGSPGVDDCGCCGGGQSGEMRVAPEGYVVFTVPAGSAGGYAVELYRSGESGKGEKVFDSRSLGKSDMLAALVLRPGTYSVTNASNGTRAELKVAYPEKPVGLLDPVKVVCSADGIRPKTIKSQPTQGIVFSFETPSRVKIDLVTPEDRARTSTSSKPKAGARESPNKHGRRLQFFPGHQARA